MSSQIELIHQAYQCTQAGDFRSAGNILESLIGVDPLDVEAWEAYMQISSTCDELDILCERVLQVPDINSVDRKSLLDYYFFLRHRKESGSLPLRYVEFQQSLSFCPQPEKRSNNNFRIERV